MSYPKSPRKQIQLDAHKVYRTQEIAPSVFTIEFEKTHLFLPGQVVAVSTKANDEEPRLYSIASGVDKPFMRILFDINPMGQLTPQLAKLKAHDTIYVSKPIGKFIGDGQEAWWIATGTGVAPFISMAESGLFENKTLLHGARTLDMFYYPDLFSELLGNKYLRFCTSQQAPGIIAGRLTRFLKDRSDFAPHIKYYLCGSSQMVIDVREILLEQKHVPMDNVVAEIYF
ncbi:MAG: FAD-binding oxidoreductase [Breznakibacter sp.]